MRVVPCLLVVALASGCGASRRVLGEEHYGALVPRSHESAFGKIVRLRGRSLVVVGELLACDEHGLYLRVHTDRTRWLHLAHDDFATVELQDSSHYGTSTAWMLTGLLSTLSHGRFLLISAPVWTITGGVAIGTSGSTEYASHPCTNELQAQARWPQGLPASLRSRFVHLHPDGTLEEASATGMVPPWSLPSSSSPSLPSNSAP